MLTTYGLTGDNGVDQTAELQKRAARCYGDQAIAPNMAASSWLNATDLARRARRSKLRDPRPPFENEGDLCDITPLLEDTLNARSMVIEDVNEDWVDGEVARDEDIPDMTLSEDAEDEEDEEEPDLISKGFEVVETPSIPFMHNGTVRKRYREYSH
jgi:hypothetical protein